MTKNVAQVCTIYLVRHGQSEWNTQGLMQGVTSGVPLTKKGVNQARELEKKFKGVKFSAIFSSDLMRARQTAQIIAFRRKLAVITTRALRERNFGDYEGKTLHQYETELKKVLQEFHSLPDKGKFKFSFPNGIESIDDTVIRVITWLREISVAYRGKNIMAVAHGGVLRLLLIHLGFSSYDELPPLSIANTAYTILECDGVDFKIKATVGVNQHAD
jgi:broad specificity phosphatase PhoE